MLIAGSSKSPLSHLLTGAIIFVGFSGCWVPVPPPPPRVETVGHFFPENGDGVLLWLILGRGWPIGNTARLSHLTTVAPPPAPHHQHPRPAPSKIKQMWQFFLGGGGVSQVKCYTWVYYAIPVLYLGPCNYDQKSGCGYNDLSLFLWYVQSLIYCRNYSNNTSQVLHK